MILLSAFLLVAVTVCLHVAGLTLLLEKFGQHRDVPFRFWPIFSLLFQVTWGLIVIHAAEITAWAVYYWARGCFQSFRTAWYFSGVTYTTLGYGDVILSGPARLLGPIEGLTGILMCGLSTGLFFMLSNRIFMEKQLNSEMNRSPGTLSAPEQS